MNPGQFYKADQLVAGVHAAQGGIFDTFRAVLLAVSGGGSPDATPVRIRCSGGSGGAVPTG